MSIRTKYEQELSFVFNKLVSMCRATELAIERSMTALTTRDKELARRVMAEDKDIDVMEREIEQDCLKILLMERPVAGDFRDVSAALKMTTDMERIGDHAADISEIELMLENLPTLSCAPIRQMATETSVMLIKSLEAFAQRDEEKANWVIDRDDVVDDLFDTVKSELIEAIRQNADNGEAATDLLMAAKYFERIGDHATNIAQWAIFSITGEMPKD